MASKWIDKYRVRQNLSPSAGNTTQFKDYFLFGNQEYNLDSPDTAKGLFFAHRPRYKPEKRISGLVKLLKEDEIKRKETREASYNASMRILEQKKKEKPVHRAKSAFNIINFKKTNQKGMAHKYRLSSYSIFRSNSRNDIPFQTTALASDSRKKQKSNKFDDFHGRGSGVKISEFVNLKNEVKRQPTKEVQINSHFYISHETPKYFNLDFKRVQTDNLAEEKIEKLDRKSSLFNLSLSAIFYTMNEREEDEDSLRKQLQQVRVEIKHLRFSTRDEPMKLLRLINKKNELKKILGNRYLLSQYLNQQRDSRG